MAMAESIYSSVAYGFVTLVGISIGTEMTPSTFVPSTLTMFHLHTHCIVSTEKGNINPFKWTELGSYMQINLQFYCCLTAPTYQLRPSYDLHNANALYTDKLSITVDYLVGQPLAHFYFSSLPSTIASHPYIMYLMWLFPWDLFINRIIVLYSGT